MSKLPRVSGPELIKALTRLGFEQVRQRGTHVVLKSGTRGCVVPLHNELKIGTLAGILRQAGVSSEDLIANL